LAREAGRVLLPEPVTAGAVLAAGVLKRSESARALRVLGRLIEGEAFVAVARSHGAGGGAPFADAGVLVSMLAHVAAHREGLEHWGATSAELRHSMARVIFTTITGETPPSN
jgi:hypothetical protein